MMKNDIAIIGMACRFPGARNYKEFWENLKNGVNSIREITSDRWDINKYYSADFREPNKSISKWCGLLDDVDTFDYHFFGISPREVNNMDPQQRILLEETWHCIEDAGLTPEKLRTKKTSVYTGFMAIDYHQEAVAPGMITESYACLGNYGSLLANRISYAFGLRGESAAIDAACASSLVAMHSARQSLLSGESDYAFVSAASLNLHPWKYISFSKARMLSPDGQCKTFDKNANGYVPGDGVGVLLLQRLRDAVQEGNHIYGIIKGTAVNHGGRTDSITAPRVEAQRDVILAAYDVAGFGAETVSYVEAHGTGTSLGDPVEMEALTQAFRAHTRKKRFCKIGSVKTNIGHLEAAAGIAGIIKVLLMMRYRMIPRTLNITSVNPIINLVDSPFEIAMTPSEWRSNQKQPVRAGISSFGFGGANAHVLIESFSRGDTTELRNDKEEMPPPYYFLLSAKSAWSLKSSVNKWRRFVEEKSFSDYRLHDICATLMTGRSHFPHRLGITVKNKRELQEVLHKGPAMFPEGVSTRNWLMRISDGSVSLKKVKPGSLLDRSLTSINKKHPPLVSSKGAVNHRAAKTALPGTTLKEHYVFLSALMDAGFAPRMITYQGGGFWTALVMSGILKLDDALAVLAGRKEPYEIQLRRPRTPFFDPVSGQTFRRFNFTKGYLRALVNGINELELMGNRPFSASAGPEKAGRSSSHKVTGAETKQSIQNRKQEAKNNQEIFVYYFKKARELKDVQFTFKSYLDDWDAVLRQSGYDLAHMLVDEKILSEHGDKPEHKKLLLLVALISSLVKLNQKWHLCEDRRLSNKWFCELLSLVVDEVMPKEALVELVSSGADYSKIAQVLNQRQHLLDENKPYEHLKIHCRDLCEIDDFQVWINKAPQAKYDVPFDESTRSLEFGAIIGTLPREKSIHVLATKDKDADNIFKEALFHLWQQGADVHWERLFPDGSFNRVALPGYEFEKKAFWLARSDELERDSELAESIQKAKKLVQTTEAHAEQNTVPATTGDGHRVILPQNPDHHHFKVVISPAHPMICNHVITGKNLIPGALMIELGRDAVEKVLRRPIHKISNIIMINPGIIEIDKDVDIEIRPVEKKFIVKKDGQPLCEAEYL